MLMRKHVLFALGLLLMMALAGCIAPVPAGTEGQAAPQTPTPVTAAGGAGIDEADLPAAALAVREALAQQLDVEPAALITLEAESVEWPDSCLGVPNPAEMCAQAITPGFRLVFELDGAQYVVHSNDDGSNFRMAEAPAPQVGTVVLEFLGDNGMGACMNVIFGTEAVSYGRCYETVRLQGNLDFGNRAAELEEFRLTYAPFSATTQAGDVTLNGVGSIEATPAEQRRIAEWASMVSREVPAGRTSNANGLLFSVSQEGGIAALCTNLSVYLSGAAYLSDCAGETPLNYPPVSLDSEQLETIYEWYDLVAPFESERTDGTADVMTTRTFFSGRGAGEVTDEQKAAIEALAAVLVVAAQANEPMPAAPAESSSGADLSVCAEGTPELVLYANDAHGYCLLVPAEWLPIEYAATSTTFTRGGDIMNHFDARLDISVEKANEATAQMAADARLADLHAALPDFQIDQQQITVGGEPAIELRALPGQDLQRVIFLTHGDDLFSIWLMPDDPLVENHADMLSLYETMVESFAFTR